MTERKHRVWIELEPTSDEETGKARAALLSRMLKRLGADFGRHEPVFWHPRHHRYCFTRDVAGGYTEAGDHGNWFNLDFFGREE